MNEERYKGRCVDLSKVIFTRKERWGGWELGQNYVLVLDQGSWREYEIDLEKCLSSAQVLDWIVQIASKAWATPEIVGTLCQAFRDVMNPQGTLCGCGIDKLLTKSDVRSLVDSYLKRPLAEEGENAATNS